MDEWAFSDLVAPHRRELRAHCYRMLGSLTDAEDLLQETLTAAWRGIEGFEGRSSVRTWLYRIATNRCLNAIRDRSRRAPTVPVPPFEPPEPSARGDVTWLQPFPDALLDGEPGPAARYELRESVELAFVAAVQRLPARQAAVLLLCDVLGYSTAEAADMIATTAASAKGLLQRARAGVGEPEDATPSAEERELARRFTEAFSSDDVDGVVALLTDDAWLRMPPAPHEYFGREAVGGFLEAAAGWRRGVSPYELVPTRANGAPAFGCRLGGTSAGVIVLKVEPRGISEMWHFLLGL